MNRLTSVTDWNSNVTTYAYDDADRMTTIALPSGTGIATRRRCRDPLGSRNPALGTCRSAGLGSTMAIVNSSGTVQNSYTYDVYGKPTVTGSLSNEFDFAGQQTDSTGLQYLRARYMDPESGTFLSRDLLEDKGGTGSNTYAYGAANPATRSDASGLAPWDGPEAGWCAKRPHWWARCAAAAGIAAFAKQATRVLYGDETDRSDAFRHCLWSACLTLDMGSKSARTLTNLHEHFDTSGSRQEQRKDLWNNSKGREIGSKIKWLVGEYAVAQAILDCRNALAHGDLIVNKNDAPYYPGEEDILPGRFEGSGGAASGGGGGVW